MTAETNTNTNTNNANANNANVSSAATVAAAKGGWLKPMAIAAGGLVAGVLCTLGYQKAFGSSGSGK